MSLWNEPSNEIYTNLLLKCVTRGFEGHQPKWLMEYNAESNLGEFIAPICGLLYEMI